ncbi:MAG: RNA-binding protein [Clostridiales bacterium]|nr:RNA-binding protein [Candidatus Crickella equi]
MTSTKFLDAHEQAIAGACIKSAPSDVSCEFWGGYPEAERRVLICEPKGLDQNVPVRNGLMSTFRIAIPRGSRELGHRDYLGSMLNLGIDRSMTGDILVRDDGADIIILPEIANFLLSEYKQVAHTEIKTEIALLSDLIIPEGRVQVIKDTVPSPRLDTVLASAFKLSRTKAAECIRSGLVSINHLETTKPDKSVEEGDVLVLRGRGKAILAEVGGESKKGRIWITINKFI